MKKKLRPHIKIGKFTVVNIEPKLDFITKNEHYPVVYIFNGEGESMQTTEAKFEKAIAAFWKKEF